MTLKERALKFADGELREYAFASPEDFAVALEEFALRERAAAVKEDRELCAKIIEIIEDMQVWRAHDKRHEIAEAIRERGTP